MSNRNIKTIGRLSLRETSTIHDEPIKYFEIVQWENYDFIHEKIEENSTCFTIALFKKENDIYNLKFIGNKPFNLDKYEVEHFWLLAKYGQTLLEAEYEFNNKTKDI